MFLLELQWTVSMSPVSLELRTLSIVRNFLLKPQILSYLATKKVSIIWLIMIYFVSYLFDVHLVWYWHSEKVMGKLAWSACAFWKFRKIVESVFWSFSSRNSTWVNLCVFSVYLTVSQLWFNSLLLLKYSYYMAM